MKDPRKKPDYYNTWRCGTSQKKWIRQGELKLKLGNGKVIKAEEWQNLLIHHSGQA